jgi:hypothetical protein
MSNNVPICPKRGLHSLRLLPYYPALKAHLDTLESLPYPAFSKPPHLGTLVDGHAALEDACQLRYDRSSDSSNISLGWDRDWKEKVRVGYEKVAQTLWRVAREFDVRGYGLVLREKLTTKWCDCGCSTDHLGEVCEKTVREDEEESGVRHGKQREWDGRGGGVYGWETEEEEDMWEVDLDFGVDECDGGTDGDMTIAETMEWRYLKAEREKEEVGFCHVDMFTVLILHTGERSVPERTLRDRHKVLPIGTRDRTGVAALPVEPRRCSSETLQVRAYSNGLLNLTFIYDHTEFIFP